MDAILAVDPGTHCGFAIQDEAGQIFSGTWHLKGGRFEGGGMRFLRLKKEIESTYEMTHFKEVYFEEVRRHKGTDAAHIYGGVVAVLTSFCEDKGIPYQGIPVGTIKKHATGKGNANKEIMLAAAKEKWPEYDIKDDNQADAMWLLDVVLHKDESDLIKE
jgi:Holliday junction resolvasome RuvABC endonuclease subunit